MKSMKLQSFGFKPSRFQAAIFDWIESGSGNVVIEAVAGSGKTTTIEQAVGLMGDNFMLCAFNVEICKEMIRRLPGFKSNIKTLHGIGYKTLWSHFRDKWDGTEPMDEEKLRKIVNSNVGTLAKVDKQLTEAIEDLCKMAKKTLTNWGEEDDLLDLAIEYEIGDGDDSLMLQAVETAPKVLKACRDDTTTIDFDDMIWFPAVHYLSPPSTYDWVCVDEAQDLSRAQRHLLMKMVGQNTRVVAVGDRKQSIYSFNGAAVDSIDRLIEDLDAKTLPLSICYRCPRSHVELAKTIVPQIEARPNAPEGTIKHAELTEAINHIQPGDMVLCRINAPLAGVAIKLIGKKIKAVVRGRDLCRGIKRLIEKFAKRSPTLIDLIRQLKMYEDEQTEKMKAEGRGKAAGSLKDRIKTIFVLAEQVHTINELWKLIDEMFSDKAEGVVCSTIHRAKGLEANNVFFLYPEMIPIKYAKTSEELVQETNLKYVGYTRAKNSLWMIPSPLHSKDDGRDDDEY